jgi:hypothetical protein
MDIVRMFVFGKMNYTEQELQELRNIVGSITDRIPQEHVSYIWNNHKRITGSTAPQPCTCPSSGKLWGDALQSIREYLKNLDE